MNINNSGLYKADPLHRIRGSKANLLH